MYELLILLMRFEIQLKTLCKENRWKIVCFGDGGGKHMRDILWGTHSGRERNC